MRNRYSFRNNVVYWPDKWTAFETGVKNLRELSVQELIFAALDDLWTPLDPDELRVTGPMWHRWVLSMPPSYAKTLELFSWKDDKESTVGDMGA